MDNATEVADLLEAAAEVIERDGWCRNELSSIDGRVCLLGALNRAQGRSTLPFASVWDSRLTRAAAYAVGERLGTSMLSVATWNDNQASDQYEVVDVLRHASKDLRNGDTRVIG